jgi:hypothetical protein
MEETMKKFRLSPEDLRVSSFQVESNPALRGTVVGADVFNRDPGTGNCSYLAYDPCGGGTTTVNYDCETYVATCPMQVSCRDSCGCSGVPTCGICV